MEQNLCIFNKAFLGEASENLSTEMVHEKQEREWTEEKTSFQERENTWKLLYEQKQQEFEKAAQEWKSREQLLLKLLREKTNPCITIDIEERFNVLNPQPKVTHLNDHVTQIELGQSGDSFYYSVVTITVEKSTPPEDVLGAPSETAEEPTAAEVEEVQEISGTVTGVISLENEGEMTKAGIEEDAANCTTGPHDDSVVDITENNKSTLAEPDASLSLVHVHQFDEVQAEDGAPNVVEKTRKNRTRRNKNNGKNEMQKRLWQEQLEAYRRTKDLFEVQKASAAESNEIQATQETTTEAELTSNTMVHDSNSNNRKKNKKDKYKTIDERGSSDVIEDCFSCSKCPNEEREKTQTEESLCEKAKSQDSDTTTPKRKNKNKCSDVPDDWLTCSTIEEPEETEVEVTSNNVVEQSLCETVEIQDSTTTTTKKKKKNRNKKTDGTEYSNQVRYNTQKYYDQYDDYEDVLLQGRKARTRVKNMAVVSTRYSDYEDHGGRKRNKRDWD